MGDVGDIEKNEDVAGRQVRFIYNAAGRGPHEWDLKYNGSLENPNPAHFAGVMFLDGDWGKDAGAGYDLRGRWNVTWEARAVTAPVSIEFLAGGVAWVWDEKLKERIPAPYPDSMPRITLAEAELTNTWQAFSEPLLLPDEKLTSVVGPFGWIVKWDANGVSASGTRTLIIEVRNVFYERSGD